MKYVLLCLTCLGFVFPFPANAAAPIGTLKTLSGHRPGDIARIAPVGSLAPTTNLSLAIGLPLHNADKLQARIRQISDPASTNYNRPLTREQFTDRFSPTEAEYQAAIAYAIAHGLEVTCRYSNRLLFDVKGSVADIEKVFHINMRLYPHPTEKRLFYAPDREPSIDPQFAILDVHGLDNFGIPHPLDLKIEPVGTNPPVSYNVLGSGPLGTLVGNDYRNAYASGVTLNGLGQSIGLFEYASYYPQDITYYAKIAGLSSINVSNISVNGFDTSPPATPGVNEFEQTGDIEVAMSMAPKATILVYEAGDMVDGFNQMASDDLAKQVSCSWGYSGPVDPLLINAINELQAQGQSVFIASGDNGSYTAKDLGNPGGFTNVTICGGTQLTLDQQYGGYQSETVWNGSGGGWATDFAMPAYQQGINMTTNHGSTSQRDIPDVAAAAVGMLATGYGTNVFVSGGGTSYSAPLWAGFLALVNQQRADNGLPSIVNLNDTLYTLGKGPNYTRAFHDITTGNNTNSTIPNNFFAVPGYDLCTGWGTPNGTNLINLLGAASDALQISPGFGFSTTEIYGSTAPAASVTFTLTNTTSSSIVWNVGGGGAWLQIPSSGTTIPAHGSTLATVSLTSAADGLAPGIYYSAVTFTNTSTGITQNRLFVLTVTAGAQPLSLSGYNAGIIVPTNGTLGLPQATNFGVGANVTFYQAGLPGSTKGLPATGHFTSAWDGQTVFQLGPAGGNDALVLGQNYSSSGTLTLTSPQSLNSLVVLAASAFATGSSTGTCVVHFADGSSHSFVYNAQDWFGTRTSSALMGFGRIDLSTFATEDNGAADPNLYQTTFPLGSMGLTQAVTSITFNVASNAVNTAIFAVSGVGGSLTGLVPTVTQQPQSTTNGSIYADSSFTVGIAGASPFDYQWYSNSVPLPYGVMPTLTFYPPISTNFAATYFCIISNQFGITQSAPATLTVVRTPPQFTQQPAHTNYTVFAGDTIVLTSLANSALAIAYSWQFNGASIPGATNTTLSLTNLQAGDSGTYTLVATTTAGVSTNNPVTVNVVPKPSALYPLTVLQLNPASYWRLDETNGATAYDYVGGDNGAYTNCLLAQPGYGAASAIGTEPSAQAAQFGPTNSYVSLPNLDLGAPNGGNGEFAIAAWVLASNSVQNGAGIIAKGYGAGDEEFAIDCGGANNAFRFFVRDAVNATAHSATTTVVPDNQWHWLVGVCDETNGTVTLFIDGTNAAQTAIAPGSGIHYSSYQGSIGARASNTGATEDLQFLGLIDDVALFTHTLSGGQVLSLYQSAIYPPAIRQQPQPVWGGYPGDSATNQVIATGQSLSYQWYGPSGVLAAETNSTLILSNLSTASAGNYYVVVSNQYWTVQSSNAKLVVQAASTPYISAALALNPVSFWRLNEPVGSVAYDSVAANNGQYLNAILAQPGYDSTATIQTDPTELAAEFGVGTNAYSYVSVPNIDFSGPANSEFSVAAWVLASSTVPASAGIVAKGAESGGDVQFSLDCGGYNGNGFRFYVRDGVDQYANASSSIVPDNKWHYLVGVCDESNGVVALYVDSALAATGSIIPGRGIHSTSSPMSIGSRQGGAGVYDLQFIGAIDDVAVFNTALSFAQVDAMFSAAMPGPRIVQQPSYALHVLAGASVTNSILCTGSNLVYQWFGPTGLIPEATNSSLVLSNFQPVQSGYYFVTVGNAFGTVQSSNTVIAVLSSKTSPYDGAVLALDPLAYWPLNETNGTIAYDYANKNDGAYTNVILGQPGYDSAFTLKTDPGEWAAQFVSNGQPSYVSIPTIDLGSPYTTAFSIAAWVKADPSVENGAGIVAKGAGNGDEQFCLDCGGPGNAFRFSVGRYSDGLQFSAVSPIVPDNRWHLLIGVCDEFNSDITLYVDGTNAASSFFNQIGTHLTSVPATMGARESAAGQPENLQFIGELNNVAIFPRALSNAQASLLYKTAAGLPQILQQPTPGWAAVQGGSTTNQIVASGMDLAIQWYGPAGAIPDATNSALILNNVGFADTGTYYALVSSPIGSVQSSNMVLKVYPRGRYASDFQAWPDGTTDFQDGSQLFSTGLGGYAKLFASGGAPAELQLTPGYNMGGATYGVSSAFLLPDLDPGTRIFAFSAKWNSEVYGINGNYGGYRPLGYGFSFNFGPLASLNLIAGSVENGYGTGLTFSENTYGNMSSLSVNGATVATNAAFQFGSYNPTRYFWEVDWNYTNGMSVWINGTALFTNVPTPGYIPHAGDRFAWAARQADGSMGVPTAEIRLANIAVVTGGNLARVQGTTPLFADSFTLASNPATNVFFTNPPAPWETSTNGGYVGETVTPPAPLVAYALTSSTNTSWDPQSWNLQGSGDDGNTWTNIAAMTDYFSYGLETRAWLTTNWTDAFGAYRLNVTTNDGGPSTALQQLRFYQLNTVPGPFATTEPASVGLSGAQLNALANPGAFPSVAWFQWGTTTGYGNTTAEQNIGNGNTNVPFSAILNGLTLGTVYHCQAVVSNQYGLFFGSDVAFTTIGNPVVFNNLGNGWTTNQTGSFTTPIISNNLLTLTDGHGSEGRSYFYNYPQYVGAFQASFTYQDVGGGGADGVAFVLQNDSRGTSAMGGVGGSLGFGSANPITPSAALELNIYNGNGQTVGYTFLTNGLTGAAGANGNYHAPGTINLASGHPIIVTLNYAGNQLALNFTDTVASVSFSTNLNVGSISNFVGGQSAYIGFTGSDGGITSTQVITNFSFVSIPTAAISDTGTNLAISWPSSITGYKLQMTTNLDGLWSTLTNQPSTVNGRNQISLPISNGKTFYRLVLP